jgi:hypothetical protein
VSKVSRIGIANLLSRLLPALIVATGSLPASARVFEDGPGGATCGFYSTFGRLAWQRPGGDWLDARGADHGNVAFAEVAIAPTKDAQTVAWNLLPLVAEWSSGRVPAGSVFLRTAVGDRGGPVNFASREHADRLSAPRLVVKWSDGKVDRLDAVADTHFACPTIRNLGAAPNLQVGTGLSALLVFPFQARPGHAVNGISLELTRLRHFGGVARVGVFGPTLPRAADGPSVGAGLSHALERDAGIGKHTDVLYAQSFDGASWRTLASDPKTEDSLRTLLEDKDNQFKPLDGKALAVTIREGTRVALNHHLRFAGWPGGEPEEAFFRYHLRLAENWDPVVDGGKLPGFAGTYGRAGWGRRPSDGTNGWSARGAFMPHDARTLPPRPLRAVGTYAYTAGKGSKSGDVWGWNLGPTGRLSKSRWYSIEQYLKLNTIGQTDGILRVWVDGELAFERTDLHWRDVPTLRIESVWLNVYHGGTAKTDRDLTLYIDNLVVARRYIGPGNFPR